MYNPTNTAFLCRKDLTLSDVADSLQNIKHANLRNLFIHSPGGEASSVVFCLRNILPRKITTIAGKHVGSSALNLFMCGSERLALPDSEFHFHETYMFFNDRILREGEVEMLIEIAVITRERDRALYLMKVLNEYRAFNRMTAQILCERTTLSFGRVRKLMQGDGTRLTAQEARFYGFVHDIIPYSWVNISE